MLYPQFTALYNNYQTAILQHATKPLGFQASCITHKTIATLTILSVQNLPACTHERH
jgi:hypothetical protein